MTKYTDDKLRVRIHRPLPEVIICEILSQPESMRNSGKIATRDCFILRSADRPEIGPDCLYLRGTRLDRDTKPCARVFNTPEECTEWVNKCRAVIRMANEALTAKDTSTTATMTSEVLE